jgi:hypothetical protein
VSCRRGSFPKDSEDEEKEEEERKITSRDTVNGEGLYQMYSEFLISDPSFSFSSSFRILGETLYPIKKRVRAPWGLPTPAQTLFRFMRPDRLPTSLVTPFQIQLEFIFGWPDLLRLGRRFERLVAERQDH